MQAPLGGVAGLTRNRSARCLVRFLLEGDLPSFHLLGPVRAAPPFRGEACASEARALT